ncbi:MAG: DegV family protein [Oscillibacter sp.]|nr:DegV family protein [Oscillibacter sp.]
MKWCIAADSSCDLFPNDLASERFAFHTIPFGIRVGEREYIDDETLDTAEMISATEACPTASRTVCPAPGPWADVFRRAEQSIAITISAKLSGSHNSAQAARDMVLEEHPDKKILLLDALSTGPALVLCLRKLAEWIEANLPMETIAEKARERIRLTNTVFALSSFDNLVKNGRVSKLLGFAARRLNIWGIGKGQEGEIKFIGKARGALKAVGVILDDMKSRGFRGGEVVISHCLNAPLAQTLREQILQTWAEAKITILPTRGLDSFYAEREGLIVSYLT